MKFFIRKANADHLEVIYSMVCQLEETRLDFRIFSEGYFFNISNPLNIYLVAEDPEGKVIGFASAHGQFLLHLAAKVYEIQELFVAPAFRGLGCGRSLLKAIEAQVKSQSSFLEVSAKMKMISCHQFYIHNGYGQTYYKFVKTLG